MEEFLKALDTLHEKEALAFYRAITRYIFMDDVPELFGDKELVWKLLQYHIDNTLGK